MDADYKKMYLTLFQAITSALETMEQLNFGTAKSILQKGQQDAEDIFINRED